jgi:hypothetical protein
VQQEVQEVDMFLTTVSSKLVDVIATEIASGVETAVEYWMAQIDRIFEDTHLTTLGRLNAVADVLERYKRLTGKTQLEWRRA